MFNEIKDNTLKYEWLFEHPQIKQLISIMNDIKACTETIYTFHPGDLHSTPISFNWWIAGGSPLALVSNREPRDFDIYFADQSPFERTRNQLNTISASQQVFTRLDLPRCLPKEKVHQDDIIKKAKEENITKRLYDTPNASCFYIKDFGQIDIIKRFFSNPIECIQSFDWKICMIAIDPIQRKIFTYEHFDILVEEQFLEFNEEAQFDDLYHVLKTINRLGKYLDKGYSIDNLELIKLIDELSQKAGFDKLYEVYK